MKIKISSIVLLALFLSPQVFAKKQNSAPSVNPLIAYWNFDEVIDNRVMDQSGNGHDGLVKGAILEEGKIGKALLLTAKDQNYISVDYSDQFNLPNRQFTLMAWVKQRSLPVETGLSTVLNFNGGYMLSLYRSRLNYIDGASWDYCSFGSFGKLEQNKWQHVAVVRNGDMVRLYIDGLEVGSRGWPGDIKPVKSKILIGALTEKSGYFDGWIDEVAIIGKALTPNVIKAKAQMGASK